MTENKYRTMLERVANELGDPMGERWCDNEQADRELLRALLTDVLAVLGGDDDHNSQSNDHKPHYYDPLDDLEPVYATLHFYYNDPDSMRRMRECLDAPKWKSAVQEFDQWMRNRLKYNPDSETAPLYISEEGIVWLEIAREQLNMRLEDYGINIWDD